MAKKYSPTIEIDKGLQKDIEEFCKLNNLDDFEKFLIECLKSGFYVAKYGMLNNSEPQVIERVVETPVEVIKYVEKEVIKEVPVEVIKYVEKEVIKEVPVEKIVEKIVEKVAEVEKPVPDTNKQQMLQETISNLKKEIIFKEDKLTEYEKKIAELTEVLQFKATYYKNSDLNQKI